MLCRDTVGGQAICTEERFASLVVTQPVVVGAWLLAARLNSVRGERPVGNQECSLTTPAADAEQLNTLEQAFAFE
jgi:hypothetical protein